MNALTSYEYAVEIQKKSGDEAPVTWLNVGELIALLRPQEDFLNAVEFALQDPAHDLIHKPEPLTEAEQQAAEAADWLERFPVEGSEIVSEPSPTKDDKITAYILSLTPDEREYVAGIIDGVSSREWWDAIKPIEY